METKNYLKIWLPSGIYYGFSDGVGKKDFSQAFKDSSREHNLDTGDSVYRIWDFRIVGPKTLFSALSKRLKLNRIGTPTFARYHKNYVLVNRSAHEETIQMLQSLPTQVHVIESLKEIKSFYHEIKMLEISKTVKESAYSFNTAHDKGKVS